MFLPSTQVFIPTGRMVLLAPNPSQQLVIHLPNTGMEGFAILLTFLTLALGKVLFLIIGWKILSKPVSAWVASVLRQCLQLPWHCWVLILLHSGDSWRSWVLLLPGVYPGLSPDPGKHGPDCSSLSGLLPVLLWRLCQGYIHLTWQNQCLSLHRCQGQAGYSGRGPSELVLLSGRYSNIALSGTG